GRQGDRPYLLSPAPDDCGTRRHAGTVRVGGSQEILTLALPGSPAPTLVRGLGLTAATSINIANMIGTGVFLKTRVMTCNVGTPGLVLAVWIAAGLRSLAGARTYAELSTMMPRAGGEYIYIREAYGRRWG